MADPQAWIGWVVLVRLKDPPLRLRGKIEKLVPGENVTLVDVWVEDKEWRERFVVSSSDIADLDIQEESAPHQPHQQPQPPAAVACATAPQPFLVQQPSRPAHGCQSLTSPITSVPPPNQHAPTLHDYRQPQQSPALVPAVKGLFRAAAQPLPAPNQLPRAVFVDPAIISVGKPPATASPARQIPSSKHSPDPKIIPSPFSREDTPNSSLVKSMDKLAFRAESCGETVDDAAAPDAGSPPELSKDQPGVSVSKRQRKRNRKKYPPGDEDLTSPVRLSREGKKGKGWRETPMLEDTASFQPYKALRRHKGNVNENGWASEDVTDVQEMPEFDFEGSLKKFDKRTIFSEMRDKDQIDDSQRLVFHNRRPKPGTTGGKNLHYTENVMDLPPAASKADKTPPDDFWKSEADDGLLNGGERLSGRELGSRQGSRRGESKPSGRRSQSRKASTAAGQAPGRVNSGASVRDAGQSRRRAKNADSQQLPSAAASLAAFYAVQTNHRVEILSPLQMLNLENIAQNDLGLTEEMMTENAGRGIAEIALHTLTDPALKIRLAAADGDAPTPSPTVVILAGNNKSGFRSIAAGRHLRCKGIHVILCVVGVERGERGLSVDVTRQLRLFRNFGGKVCSKDELFEHVRKASMPVISMDAPRSVLPQAPPMAVTLIIDALLGHVTPFDDLRASEQATVYELIEWTNRNEAFVLAVDLPTGLDHTSGRPTVQDGHSLYIRPRYVVSIGAPKKGLLEAIAAQDDDDIATVTGRVSDDSATDWSLFLVDIGLGAAVWKRAGTKIRRGIDFGNKWALQMKYRPSEVDQAEE